MVPFLTPFVRPTHTLSGVPGRRRVDVLRPLNYLSLGTIESARAAECRSALREHSTRPIPRTASLRKAEQIS